MPLKFNPLVFGGLDYFQAGKEYTAKAAGGLELAGTEFLVKALGITNAMLAGSIAPSKVTGTAVVESEKAPGTWPYLYKTGGSTKPAAGTFTTNNATPNLVTKIYINQTEGAGHNIQNWLSLLAETGGLIELSYPGEAGNFQQYLVAPLGAAKNETYFEITVTRAPESGVGAFAEEARFTILPTGVYPWFKVIRGAKISAAREGPFEAASAPSENGVRAESYGATARMRGILLTTGEIKSGATIFTLGIATPYSPSPRPTAPVNISIKRAKVYRETVKLNSSTTLTKVAAATCTALEAALATGGVLVFGVGIPSGVMVRSVNVAKEEVVISETASESAENEVVFAIAMEPTMAMVAANGTTRCFDILAENTLLFLDGIIWNTV